MKRAFVVVIGMLAAALAGGCGEDAAPPASRPQAAVCLSDAECASGTCDPFRGCVDCRTAAQCSSGERCLGGSCQQPKLCETDAECSEGGQHCEPGTLTCVECTGADHCRQGAACVDGACQPASFCSDAAGCRLGTVCDLAQGRCVECLGNLDCGAGGRCVDQHCTSSCQSSSECAAGLVCDPLLHVCSECVTTDDCAASEHCARGRCVLDVCVAGSGTCEGPSHKVMLCGSAGDGVTPFYCGKHAACLGAPGQATCSDWVCKPSTTACNADERHLETCSFDGLMVSTSVDCNASNQACVGSACIDIVCEPDQVSCDAVDNSLRSCSSNGTVETITKCSATQYCDPDRLACLEKVCTPDTVLCVGEQVGTCDALGSDYASLEDCEPDETCVAGACTPIVCDPLDELCGDDGNAYACNDSGTVLSLIDTCEQPGENTGGEPAIGYGQHCQDHGTEASCYSDPCVKGQLYCEDNHVKTCKTDGTGPVDDGTDCGSDSVCLTSGGAHCTPKICAPSTKFCDAGSGDVLNCSANGTSSYLWDDCTANEYCDASSATCKTKVCTPNAAGCNGTVAATCNAEGSGWLANGTDCSVSGQACDGGSCKDIVCAALGYLCKSGDVHQCNALGTGAALYQSCSANYHCVEGNQYCSYDVCTQGQPGCNGTVATTCNASGSGWVAGGTDCSLTNEICDAGACKTQICTPYAYTCVGGNVARCNSLGTATTSYDTCLSTEYCRETYSACQADVCTNGAKLCDEGVPTTCKADGSGPVPGGTPCAQNEICVSGDCLDVVCTASQKFCGGGHVQECNATGTAYSQAQFCFSTEYCDEATATCKKRLCNAGSSGCEGEIYGACNADGSGYDAAPNTNCTSSAQICTMTGCGATAVDVLGGTSGSYPGLDWSSVDGEVVYVTATRELTKLEFRTGSTSALWTLHWAIYESSNLQGPFTPIFDIAVPGGAAGWRSTGPISVTVTAGKYYFIGVLVEGDGASVTYHASEGPLVTPVSFARQMYGFNARTNSGALPLSFSVDSISLNGRMPSQRITSVAP